MITPSVQIPFVAQVIGGQHRWDVAAELAYDPVADPYAVRLTFLQGDQLAPWTFDRRLLVDGLCGPVGIGDVKVWPHAAAAVAVHLSSPDGRALFMLPRRVVVEFLARAHRVVRLGTEADWIDHDALIGQINRWWVSR